MTVIKALKFIDQADKEQACAIIKVEEGLIVITFTIETVGDFDIAMKPEDCKDLMKCLGEAVLSTVPGKGRDTRP